MISLSHGVNPWLDCFLFKLRGPSSIHVYLFWLPKRAADLQRMSKSSLDGHLLQFGCFLSKNLADLLL